MNYAIHLAIYLFIYTLAAVGLNFIVGSCGRLSLAHACFFATGAYLYAICTVAFNVPPLISLFVGGLGTSILAIPFAVAAWRFKGDMFVLISIAVQVLGLSIITNWFNTSDQLGTIGNMTNGPFGILGIPSLKIGGINKSYSIIIFLVLTTIIIGGTCLLLLRSPWGRVLISLRDDELAAQSLGKPKNQHLTEAIIIGCVLSGIAGSFYASYAGAIYPSLSSLDHSVALLAMLLIGGTGNLWGSIFGAGIFLLIPEILRALPLNLSIAANGRGIAMGILLLIVIHRFPGGIFGEKTIK